MDKSREIKAYNCPKYNNKVILSMEYLHHSHNHKVVSSFKCDSDKECGIGTPDGRGGYDFDYSLCPADGEIAKMNKKA